MKKFVVINGTNVFIIERETMEQARNYAINFMNHSKETIVRECRKFTDHTKVFVNQPIK